MEEQIEKKLTEIKYILTHKVWISDEIYEELMDLIDDIYILNEI